jgi:uncharacterized protein
LEIGIRGPGGVALTAFGRSESLAENIIMSKKESSAGPGLGRFAWNELVTKNVPAAKKFYGGLFGWKTKPFGKGGGYTLFMRDKDMAGGLMKNPKPGRPSQWVPYVIVKDVDASAKKAAKIGGQVVLQPTDIPTVGRIAVVCDPQGAVIGLFKPMM